MSDADKPEQPSSKHSPAPSPATPSPEKKKTPPKPAKSGSSSSLPIALLALLLGGASAGWLGYQFWQDQQGLQEKPWQADIRAARTALESTLENNLQSQQRQALKAMREQLDARESALQENFRRQQLDAESALREQQQYLNSLKAELAQQRNRLNDVARLNRDDWLLAEAEYLLRLAQQRLNFGVAASETASLVNAAQRSLQSVRDADVQAVIEVVDRDLEALQSAARFDLQGLQSDIENLAAEAGALVPLADGTLIEAQQRESTPAPELTWRNTWPLIQYAAAQTLETFKSYVRVSDRDSKYQQTVLAGGQRALFQQNLQLLFEQAQWALLSGNAELYQKALARCEDWLKRYYRNGEAEQAVLTELQNLAQRPIRANTPPLAASLDALRLYIDQRHSGQPDAEAPQ